MGRNELEFSTIKPNTVRASVLPLPQTVIAERTSYSSVDGSVMADGNERKVGGPNPGGEGRDRRLNELLQYRHVFGSAQGCLAGRSTTSRRICPPFSVRGFVPLDKRAALFVLP